MFWKTPSNNRDWSPDQIVLPSTVFDGNLVHIKNIRNCTYRTRYDFDVHHYDKTFNLDEIERVWLLIEPFSKIPGVAHILLSFEFKENNFIAISPEIRKKKGEIYSTVKGMLNTSELTYVIGDEQDLIKLRSNYRHDIVYLYPIVAPQKFVRELFVDMLRRSNKLNESPEFYNTLWNTCGGNLVDHVNKVAPDALPWSIHRIFPRNADLYLRRLGFIDTSVPIEKLRERNCINDRAEQYANSPDFSVKIRR